MNRRGFSLMDSMMAIIIGIVLTSLAVSKFTVMIEKGRAQEAMNTIMMIRQSEVLYAVDNGAYTTDLSKLSVSFPTSSTDTYWTYIAQIGGGVYDLTVTAYRTARNCPPGKSGLTIRRGWVDSTGQPGRWWGSYSDVIPGGTTTYA